MAIIKRADTKVRPYINSLTLTLSQRERRFLEWIESINSMGY